MAAEGGDGSLLLAGMRNGSAQDRLRIVTQLLEDGADAATVDSDGMNALHLLLSDSGGAPDYDLDAQLLRHLLDGGADINQRHKRYGTPLVLMYDEGLMSNGHAGAGVEALWDVLFERTDLDFDVVASRDGSKRTLRDLIVDTERRGWNVTMFRERLREYEIRDQK